MLPHTLKRKSRDEPCGICGHYHNYEGGEPCATCGHCLTQGEAAQPPSALPAEVLPGFLFLGSYDHASRQELLKALGIGHILNTVPTCPNLYKNSFDYVTVSASPPPLGECCAYLEQVRAGGGKVLVHCMSGTSRAPAVVIHYLMRVLGQRLDEAYSLVAAKSPAVAINQADAERLRDAEAELFGAGASGMAVPVRRQTAGVPPPPQQQQQEQQQQGALPLYQQQLGPQTQQYGAATFSSLEAARGGAAPAGAGFPMSNGSSSGCIVSDR